MTLPDFITDELLAAVGSVLGMALLYGLSRIKNATVRYLANLAVDKGIPIAFNYVEELSRKTETKIDDKAAVALKALKEYLETYGVELTPGQESRARLVFNALHAETRPPDIIVGVSESERSRIAQASFGFVAGDGTGVATGLGGAIKENK